MSSLQKDFLDYDDHDNPLNPVVDRISRIIKNDVDYCIGLMSELLVSEDKGYRSNLVALLFRDFLELHDSLGLMCKAKVCKPTSLLVRSQFEILLAGLHLLEKQGDLRAYSYSVCKLLDELDACRQVVNTVDSSKGDEEGEQRVVLEVMRELYDKATFDSDRVEELLSSKRLRDIYAEFKRTKKERNIRYPAWYSLHDGPASLGKLSSYHGMSSWYNYLYGTLSRTAHGKDATHSLMSSGGVGRVLRLRSGIDVPFSANCAHVFCMRFADSFVEELARHRIQSHAKWRLETRSEFLWLNQFRIKIEETD